MKDNKMHGKGTYIFKNGDRYEGIYINGMKDGRGVHTYINGEKYDGDWKVGQKNGKGNFIYSNGDIFDGDWKNGQKLGKGIQIYKDGSRYEGDWKDSKKNGKGKYIHKDGDKYEGDWKFSKKDGKGVYTFSNGNKYDGCFKDDNINGLGVFIYSNGDRYEGNWKDSKRDGVGSQIFISGAKYEGSWKNGNYDGKGVFTYPNGFKWSCFWLDGKERKPEPLENSCKTIKTITESASLVNNFNPFDSEKILQILFACIDLAFLDNNIEERDFDGNTIMHLVASDERLGGIPNSRFVLEHLFSKGARDTILNLAGQTPLDCANASKNNIIVEQWTDIKSKGLSKEGNKAKHDVSKLDKREFINFLDILECELSLAEKKNGWLMKNAITQEKSESNLVPDSDLTIKAADVPLDSSNSTEHIPDINLDTLDKAVIVTTPPVIMSSPSLPHPSSSSDLIT